MEQRDGNCHKMSQTVVKCRKLSWRLSQIVVTFFFPVPFPPSPFGFRRSNKHIMHVSFLLGWYARQWDNERCISWTWMCVSYELVVYAWRCSRTSWIAICLKPFRSRRGLLGWCPGRVLENLHRWEKDSFRASFQVAGGSPFGVRARVVFRGNFPWRLFCHKQRKKGTRAPFWRNRKGTRGTPPGSKNRSSHPSSTPNNVWSGPPWSWASRSSWIAVW